MPRVGLRHYERTGPTGSHVLRPTAERPPANHRTTGERPPADRRDRAVPATEADSIRCETLSKGCRWNKSLDQMVQSMSRGRRTRHGWSRLSRGAAAPNSRQISHDNRPQPAITVGGRASAIWIASRRIGRHCGSGLDPSNDGSSASQQRTANNYEWNRPGVSGVSEISPGVSGVGTAEILA
jgi:hypothetical protein